MKRMMTYSIYITLKLYNYGHNKRPFIHTNKDLRVSKQFDVVAQLQAGRGI